MVELTEKSPCAGVLPIEHGSVTLEELPRAQLTALSPLADRQALSAALEAAHGMALPRPNRSTGKEGARCLWFGRDQYLLIGPDPDPALGAEAAVVDQSDAWAVVTLEGADAADVLARLVPVDLRAQDFKRGHTARTQLGHMHASITRTGPERFMILVFRSMAGTLVHDLRHAMAAVASRR